MLSSEKIKILKDSHNIENIYQFGSRVYGSHNVNSDWDYIVVAKEYFDSEDINIHVFTTAQFHLAIQRHDIQALECLFLDPQYIIKETVKYTFTLSLSDLRREISTIANNAWVKGKKKLIMTGDYSLPLAIKSVFHSLRILDYGIQIAMEGKIVNYASRNYILEDLWKMSETLQRDDLWAAIYSKYDKHFKEQKSIFVKLAPKDLTEKTKRIQLIELLESHDLNVDEHIINDILNIFQ